MADRYPAYHGNTQGPNQHHPQSQQDPYQQFHIQLDQFQSGRSPRGFHQQDRPQQSRSQQGYLPHGHRQERNYQQNQNKPGQPLHGRSNLSPAHRRNGKYALNPKAAVLPSKQLIRKSWTSTYNSNPKLPNIPTSIDDTSMFTDSVGFNTLPYILYFSSVQEKMFGKESPGLPQEWTDTLKSLKTKDIPDINKQGYHAYSTYVDAMLKRLDGAPELNDTWTGNFSSPDCAIGSLCQPYALVPEIRMAADGNEVLGPEVAGDQENGSRIVANVMGTRIELPPNPKYRLAGHYFHSESWTQVQRRFATMTNAPEWVEVKNDSRKTEAEQNRAQEKSDLAYIRRPTAEEKGLWCSDVHLEGSHPKGHKKRTGAFHSQFELLYIWKHGWSVTPYLNCWRKPTPRKRAKRVTVAGKRSKEDLKPLDKFHMACDELRSLTGRQPITTFCGAYGTTDNKDMDRIKALEAWSAYRTGQRMVGKVYSPLPLEDYAKKQALVPRGFCTRVRVGKSTLHGQKVWMARLVMEPITKREEKRASGRHGLGAALPPIIEGQEGSSVSIGQPTNVQVVQRCSFEEFSMFAKSNRKPVKDALNPNIRRHHTHAKKVRSSFSKLPTILGKMNTVPKRQSAEKAQVRYHQVSRAKIRQIRRNMHASHKPREKYVDEVDVMAALAAAVTAARRKAQAQSMQRQSVVKLRLPDVLMPPVLSRLETMAALTFRSEPAKDWPSAIGSQLKSSHLENARRSVFQLGLSSVQGTRSQSKSTVVPDEDVTHKSVWGRKSCADLAANTVPCNPVHRQGERHAPFGVPLVSRVSSSPWNVSRQQEP